MHDLIVVGAGPAGLATALYAARAGLDTVVIDKRTGPVDKACGEGLMPGAVAQLSGLGVELAGTPIRGIRYVDGRHSAEAPFRKSTGRGVRRTELHAALLHKVHAAGIPIEHATVDDVTQSEDQVSAAGFTARYLVAADGLHSPIRRSLQLNVPVAARYSRWGQRQHFAIAPWTDLVEVHWSAHAEGYVTPIAEDLVGVAVLSNVRAGFAEHLEQFPALAARLPADGATAVRGAGPLRQKTRRRVAGRVLLVGDAAGYVDALTGEGIAVALKSAQALVSCVVADEPERYEREWTRASRNYRVITSALLGARRHRVLQRSIVPLASAVPALFGVAVNQLAR